MLLAFQDSDSKLLVSVLKLLNAIIEYCAIDATHLFEQVLPSLIGIATGRQRRASRMLRKQDSFFVTKFSKNKTKNQNILINLTK